MAYNTRRKRRRDPTDIPGIRGRPVKRKPVKRKPVLASDGYSDPDIIQHGVKDATLNSCMLNAHKNAIEQRTQHSLRYGSEPPGGGSVRIAVGSMGFRSDDGSKTHWEYGGVGWKKAHQFSKGGGVAWDAHAWVVYTLPQGQEVIIDPFFPDYSDYCLMWGIRTADVSASRVYYELDGRERDRLFDGMVATTKLHARDGAKMTDLWREWGGCSA